MVPPEGQICNQFTWRQSLSNYAKLLFSYVKLHLVKMGLNFEVKDPRDKLVTQQRGGFMSHLLTISFFLEKEAN